MGAGTRATDYSWRHGFYECEKRFNRFLEESGHLIETRQKAYVAKDFPNATGRATKPEGGGKTGGPFWSARPFIET